MRNRAHERTEQQQDNNLSHFQRRLNLATRQNVPFIVHKEQLKGNPMTS